MTEPAPVISEFTRDETAATLATLLGVSPDEVGCYLIICERPDGSLTAQTDLEPSRKLLALKWAAEAISHD